MPQKRDHFRIVFPVSQRPCLVAAADKWEIIDLSETSIKVDANRGTSLASRDPFAAVIRFHDGTTAEVVAAFLRCENDHAILNFAQPLPYPLIMGEQLRLLRLFPRGALAGSALVGEQPISQQATAAP